MRYIKPLDFKSVKEVEEHYKRLEQDITELLLNDASATTAQELNKKLNLALNAAMSYLTKVNKDFTSNELQKAFKEGQTALSSAPKLSVEKAQAILEKQGYKYAKNGFSRDTYIELQTATKTALNGVKTRVNEIIKDLRKEGQDSVYNVQQALIKELQEHNLTKVKYSNGAEMPLSAYAAMAARSARIESTNIGSIGSALQNGTDLVKMTTMPQCCRLCGAYQGKVYSITGKDKRFPALFKTVLKNGYALPHPNCRHEFLPWFEEMEAPEDVEKAIKQSKIKYDSKGNLVDVRYQKDIEAYQAWQAGNRQRNREMLEFEQMQAYYKGKENEMPYKTLASFRRARRADNLSSAFKAWRYRERDKKQYEEWIKKLGKENMPEDIDKFSDIKYNNPNKYQQILRDLDLHRQYMETVEKFEVTNIGFVEYKKIMIEATQKIVGIKTSDGKIVEGITKHLVDRIIGSEKQKRKGVSIDKVVECLQKGTIVKNKAKSIKYFFNDVEVSFNPITNKVIQCNPKTRK